MNPIVPIVFLLLTIAIGVTSIYVALFFFEAGVSSITNTYLLCNVVNNGTFSGFKCPEPWYYSSYEELMDSSRIIAKSLFGIYVACVVLGSIYQLVVVIFMGRSSSSAPLIPPGKGYQAF
jgi:hypothetical protein